MGSGLFKHRKMNLDGGNQLQKMWASASSISLQKISSAGPFKK
jgi:hypothetical protein